MRIGIDGRYIQDHFPGIGRYVYHLIGALAEQAPGPIVVFHSPMLPNTRFDISALGRYPHVELVRLDVPTFSLWEQVRVPLAVRAQRLDVFHTPFYIKPLLLPCPTVTTLYDLTPARFPEYLPSRRAEFVYELTTRWAIKTSTCILTPSESTKRDLVELCGAPEQRISVAYWGVDAHFTPQTAVEAVRRRYEVPQAFILYVGINKPHKNLARLVAAFAQLAVQIPDVALVLAGRPDPRYDDAQRAVSALGIAGRVRFIGDVAEADLPALYSSAACFAFPSLYEGFGLPVLEAMACGTPVVCSNAGSLPEVVGDAALQVPPQDVHALAAALSAVLQDGRLWTHLHRAGLVRAQAFTWERTARETLKVYEAARNVMRAA